MRFIITMNMPAKSGVSIHQIICEHGAKDLSNFVEALSANDFLIVEEFYKDPQVGTYYSVGHVALNYRFVGKVKVMSSTTHQHRPSYAPVG